MNITNASKEAITSFIIGKENDMWKSRTGKELVALFQRFGFRDDKYDNQSGLPRLNNSKLNTSKSNYVKDRVCKLSDSNLKNLIEQIVTDSAEKIQAINQINKIIVLDNIQLSFNKGDFSWKGIKTNNIIENDVAFKENEKKVIDAINSAKVSILVAMAWFTNETIKEALEVKRQEGLQIEIVTFRDGVNASYGVDLSTFDHKEIRGTRGGIMHNKFCVIDNQIVITGSYNWSTNAESRNDENVLITKDNISATEYSVEFRRLKPLL